MQETRSDPNYELIFVVFVLLGGCGEDRLSDLVSKFPQQRTDLNEAKQLVQSLASTEGILGIMVGSKYNDIPDKVWLRHNSPPTPVQSIELKSAASKPKLDRLRVVANYLSCAAVAMDEFSQVRVTMYSGSNYDYGYEYFDHDGAETRKEGDYVVIPGEEKWLAFRR